MEAGQVLGSYRIVKLLGVGGMGEVYQAEDTRLDRMVALKVLPPEFSSDSVRLERFEREAKAVAAIEHPNVVTIHSVEEIEGVRFLTMEMVRGRTLAQLLRAGGMPLERVFEIVVPLAEGLSAAHDLGIVHRDLKPANIMLTDDGRVKILDFGLAKLRSDPANPDASHLPTEAITEEGRVLGTVSYMSPEQVKAQPADGRSDIFSFGVILYEIVAGVRPFRGETWADVSSSIIRDVPAPVTDLKKDLPEHLGRIVRRCLEKNPDRRYQSALDLRNELDGLAREVDGSATSMVAVAGGRRSVVSAPRLVVAAAGIALVGLIAWLWTSPGVEGPGDVADRAAGIRSIAVLPFHDLNAMAGQDYLADGMHEALITELSKTGLLVIGQRSTMRFKESELSMPEIAAWLDVDGLVDGSVLRVGDEVRVSAQLIHGPSDTNIWADSYDRDLSDVLLLTSEVARTIADQVQIILTPAQEQRLTQTDVVDPAAWEAYVRGSYQLNRFTGEGFREARRLFQEAIDADPEFAPAWAGLGFAYGVPASTRGEPDPELVTGAFAAIARALELDGALADAHAALGHGELLLNWDWGVAERELQLALDLKPNSALARHGYADLLTILGRPDEAVEQVKLGRQYDPLSPLSNIPVAAHLMLARRYDEAIEEYRIMRRQMPSLPERNSWTAGSLWSMGALEDAVAEYRMMWGLQRNVELLDAFNEGYADAGPTGAARAAADLLAASASAGDSSLAIATWYARAQDPQGTLHWLNQAYELHIPTMPVLLARADFDIVRNDPAFLELESRLGIPRQR